MLVGIDGNGEKPTMVDNAADDADELDAEMIEMLLAVWHKLDWKYQKILYLHYVCEVSNKATAQVLGINEVALRQRLCRAREKLRAIFHERQ